VFYLPHPQIPLNFPLVFSTLPLVHLRLTPIGEMVLAPPPSNSFLKTISLSLGFVLWGLFSKTSYAFLCIGLILFIFCQSRVYASRFFLGFEPFFFPRACPFPFVPLSWAGLPLTKVGFPSGPFFMVYNGFFLFLLLYAFSKRKTFSFRPILALSSYIFFQALIIPSFCNGIEPVLGLHFFFSENVPFPLKTIFSFPFPNALPLFV